MHMYVYVCTYFAFSLLGIAQVMTPANGLLPSFPMLLSSQQMFSFPLPSLFMWVFFPFSMFIIIKHTWNVKTTILRAWFACRIEGYVLSIPLATTFIVLYQFKTDFDLLWRLPIDIVKCIKITTLSKIFCNAFLVLIWTFLDLFYGMQFWIINFSHKGCTFLRLFFESKNFESFNQRCQLVKFFR